MASEWPWQMVNNPLFGTLVGAFLGAFLGYWSTIYLQHKELNSKRDALFRLLVEEGGYAADKGFPSYSTGETGMPVPIRFTAARQLLDGHVLSYRAHADLIKAFLQLDWYVSAFNNSVEYVDQASAKNGDRKL